MKIGEEVPVITLITVGWLLLCLMIAMILVPDQVRNCPAWARWILFSLGSIAWLSIGVCVLRAWKETIAKT